MKWLAALAVVAVGSAREGSRFNRAIDLDKLEEDLNIGDEKDEAWGDLEKVKTKTAQNPFREPRKAPGENGELTDMEVRKLIKASKEAGTYSGPKHFLTEGGPEDVLHDPDDAMIAVTAVLAPDACATTQCGEDYASALRASWARPVASRTVTVPGEIHFVLFGDMLADLAAFKAFLLGKEAVDHVQRVGREGATKYFKDGSMDAAKFSKKRRHAVLGGLGNGRRTDAKMVSAHLKTGACETLACCDALAALDKQTFGKPLLSLTCAAPDRVDYVFLGAQVKSVAAFSRHLLAKDEVAFVMRDGTKHFPDGSVDKGEECAWPAGFVPALLKKVVADPHYTKGDHKFTSAGLKAAVDENLNMTDGTGKSEETRFYEAEAENPSLYYL